METIQFNLLSETIQKAALFVSKDKYRGNILGIHLNAQKQRIESTDGHSLYVHKHPLPSELPQLVLDVSKFRTKFTTLQYEYVTERNMLVCVDEPNNSLPITGHMFPDIELVLKQVNPNCSKIGLNFDWVQKIKKATGNQFITITKNVAADGVMTVDGLNDGEQILVMPIRIE